MISLENKILELKELSAGTMGERLKAELRYAYRVSSANGGKYDDLVLSAVNELYAIVERQGAITNDAVLAIEKMLAPMAAACKQYNVICIGHAHIDMNWMWRYDETVSITLDTFRTVLNLMNEFPTFTFAQSQASVYRIVEEFEPTMLEEIAKRVKEGRWEVAASTWVEADRNMPSSESVARHHLYTKRYLPKLLGISEDSLNFDFEPDTFGHNANVPELLSQAGVKYYYHCRGHEKDFLCRWQSPSGAEIIKYLEPYWYLGDIEQDFVDFVPEFCQRYGMNTYLKVYGVGDHGGGPTRRDLQRLTDMATWPIFPSIECGTYAQFFSEVEKVRQNLPIIKGELNAVFTGCYTTQTRIKMGNRMGEKLMMEAEGINAFANIKVNAPYDRSKFEGGWRNILFNQFHDIIPGSGVIDTREHAMGFYQQAYAVANMAKRNSYNAIAGQIDTSKLIAEKSTTSRSQGAGVGFGVYDFKLAQVERGNGNSRIFHFFNPITVSRTEVVELTIWDMELTEDTVEFTDAKGKVLRHQIVSSGKNHYWGHTYTKAFVEVIVPAMGYATIVLNPKARTSIPYGFALDWRREVEQPYVLENEFLRIQIHSVSGEIISFYDKMQQKEQVSFTGAGFYKVMESASRGMTAWVTGRYKHETPLNQDAEIKFGAKGDLMNEIIVELPFGSSKLTYTYSLKAGSSALDCNVEVDWQEKGDKSGIPQLQYVFPLAGTATEFYYDVPAGVIVRETLGQDYPAQSFIGTVNEAGSMMLLSDNKYGFRGEDEALICTLIRSSYDPDPYPELGIHKTKLAIGCFDKLTEAQMVQFAQCWNHPLNVVSGTAHDGALPLDNSFIELVSGDVIISAIKLSEDSDSLIIRGYSLKDTDQTVTLKLGAAGQKLADAWMVDTMEQPIGGLTTIAGDNQIKFSARAKGIWGIKVGV